MSNFRPRQGQSRFSRNQSSNRFRHTGARINPSRYINEAVEPGLVQEIAVTHAFSDFGFEPALLKNVEKQGYTQPTPIQDEAIPAMMAGRDVVGLAQTGTGKTAAFLLPLINKVMLDPQQGVLIVAPTRELALQIEQEFWHFARGLQIGAVLCTGGLNMTTQIQKLKRNPHFVIGTPGRLKDLITRRAFDTSLFTNIVLDEVDRMLDIGFVHDIKFLIAHLPSQRQAGFFSATMTREVSGIMESLLKDPVMISIQRTVTSAHIEQNIIQVNNGRNKIDVLHELLLQEEFERVIVFGRTKHGINKLEEVLSARGLRVSSIHGNKNQNARQRSLDNFKRGRVQVLLATDVASRGIDVDGVTHVINYDEPQSYEDYIHRIGRTGRAGKAGKALTFVG